MKKIAIFGAGHIGQKVLKSIGAESARCFVDNNRHGMPLNGIEVISFEEYLKIQDTVMLIVASGNYAADICAQLEAAGIENYFVYPTKTTNNNIYGGHSFSQHGEDMAILNIFLALGIKTPSYLDVGAHHPYDISNTALMYKLGCRGINIEANPNLIKAFMRERPDDINLNVGISAKGGEDLTFYMIDDFSGRNSFSLEVMEDFCKKYPKFQISETKQIRCVSLMDIVNEYAGGVFPDFLDIDIEGFDYDVLMSCDFSCGKPMVISAENDGETDITNMLSEKGYAAYCRMHGNMIYVRKELLLKILL